ncbi:hypothetical protein IQ22_01683 [Pseudomonas duriflava]|uniref:Uncharacterized protein n=1 Tax=Pseudomonas duriflava TaxID=459528 RepID=A0A562QF34_9PSED|nr:hypothetical protein IQ22_01683 [Pseudomonas duriflava]
MLLKCKNLTKQTINTRSPAQAECHVLAANAWCIKVHCQKGMPANGAGFFRRVADLTETLCGRMETFC